MESEHVKTNTSNNEFSQITTEILSYINIIKNMNEVINTECCNNIYTKTIKSSCNKITNILLTLDNEDKLISLGECHSINLKTKVDEIAFSYKTECDKRNIIIDIDMNDIKIHTNETLIEKVIINLFQYAIHSCYQNNIMHVTCIFIYPFIQLQFKVNNMVEDKNNNLKLCKKIAKHLGGNINNDLHSSRILLKLPIHPKLLQPLKSDIQISSEEHEPFETVESIFI